ncbi:NAD(P)/FAD-dependent oxidoreductase [Aureimonas sp. SK2]|uniref:NAD(P)/FAD-dependent oxidoreductase n=1 Tax=Aureimonas sp. SK2 TaxID=3015992 RepID=UPI0024442F6B|nr:FAD-dependent oxidoreductase [Aureimonas sp. SK2]
MTQEHRIVVVGGGVAGLDIASHLGGKQFGDRRFSVTLVDREPAHVWKPMLHTIAAGTQEVTTQQTSYLVQAHNRGFAYEPGEVTSVDREGRSVRVAALRLGGDDVLPERSVVYDTLVLAVGSEANDFGTPGVDEHCRTINSRGEAIAFNDLLRTRMLKAFAAGKAFSVAIVGGGATGVELAAEIVQLVDLVEHYGIADAGEKLRVTLIESGDRLLGSFPERVSREVRKSLEQMGVHVRTGARVARADECGFSLPDGGYVEADLKVWAAGVRAPTLIRSIEGIERTPAGQVVVGRDLVCVNDRSIVAVGDCASIRGDPLGKTVPTTAQAASQQAAYVIDHLATILDRKQVSNFDYRDFGSLVSLGGYDAYGTLGRFGLFKGGFLRGRVAQIGHAMLYRRHQVRLHGLRRGSLLWISDMIGSRVRPRARLS